METSRRGFLGILGSTVLPSVEIPKAEPSIYDQFFDTIPNVPCMPVDTWINRMKPYMWQQGQFPWCHLQDVMCDCLPVFYPREVVAKAILAMPVRLPTIYPDKKIPLYYVSNARIMPLLSEEWLIVDVVCAKKDLPPEFDHLTILKKDNIQRCMDDKIEDFHHRKFLWPDYWGHSGMTSDLWPVSTGIADISPSGVRVREMEISQFVFCGASPCCGPIPLHAVWKGDVCQGEKKVRWKKSGYIDYARDRPEEDWNPFWQVPHDILEKHWYNLLRHRQINS